MQSTELTVQQKNLEIAKQIDNAVSTLFQSDVTDGFQKAFSISNAIVTIGELLTPEYMAPIMKLQNNKLGFKTDKKDAGYPEDVVKNCVIEAVLMGLQPTGNQINIIQGQTYPTREGFSYLLDNKTPSLESYDISYGLPNVENNQTYVPTTIKWKLKNGEEKFKEIKFPVIKNQNMSADALWGKAERKAKRWLYYQVTGRDIADADAEDATFEVVSSETKKQPVKPAPVHRDNAETTNPSSNQKS
jgi:hypothetical protein